MKVAIACESSSTEPSWHVTQLAQAFEGVGADVMCFSLNRIAGRIGYGPLARTQSDNQAATLDDVDAIVVRPIGMGSAEELFFKMDFLRRLERSGVTIVNSPQAIERAVNKYTTLAMLEEEGLPVPKTAVATTVAEALAAFHELGGDVVVKPLFGSRGRGIARVTDPEVALRIFQNLAYFRHVIYVQKFIQHGGRDYRLFVVGNEVAAAMVRSSDGWKTNIAQGARPENFLPTRQQAEDALRASKIIGCEVAGVDLLPTPEGGYVFTEVNSQPGWRGLQSVAEENIAKLVAKRIAAKVRR